MKYPIAIEPGHGKYTYPDGESYEGGFVNGKEHGHGKYTWVDGRFDLGPWVNSAMHGYHTLTFPNGEVKKIEYKNGEVVKK